MAAQVTIRTSKPGKEVKALLRGLGSILSGRKEDQYGLCPVFYGVMAKELYKRISAAYAKKAEGFTDDLDNEWAKLAPRTVKNRLSAKLVNRYPLSARLLILRVSDALYSSLHPGEFDGSTYHPSKEQIFHYNRGKLKLGSRCSHASYAHAKRPLWPEEMDPWIQASIDLAMQAVTERIKEVIQ